jgi:hypothetical protein
MILIDTVLLLPEIEELFDSCDVLRTCPNISEKAVGFHRNYKQLKAIMENKNEEISVLKENIKVRFDLLKKENPDTNSIGYKETLATLNKELSDMIKKVNSEKITVGLYIFSREDFPFEPTELGSKELAIQVKNEKSVEVVKHTVSYWDSFVRTIDVIVLEKEEYEAKLEAAGIKRLKGKIDKK